MRDPRPGLPQDVVEQGKQKVETRTVSSRGPKGDSPVVMYKTSQTTGGYEVWASKDGLVALGLENGDLNEVGGWSQQNNKAWEGVWPNHNEEDVKKEDAEMYRSAVEEVKNK